MKMPSQSSVNSSLPSCSVSTINQTTTTTITSISGQHAITYKMAYLHDYDDDAGNLQYEKIIIGKYGIVENESAQLHKNYFINIVGLHRAAPNSGKQYGKTIVYMSSVNIKMKHISKLRTDRQASNVGYL